MIGWCTPENPRLYTCISCICLLNPFPPLFLSTSKSHTHNTYYPKFPERRRPLSFLRSPWRWRWDFSVITPICLFPHRCHCAGRPLRRSLSGLRSGPAPTAAAHAPAGHAPLAPPSAPPPGLRLLPAAARLLALPESARLAHHLLQPAGGALALAAPGKNQIWD